MLKKAKEKDAPETEKKPKETEPAQKANLGEFEGGIKPGYDGDGTSPKPGPDIDPDGVKPGDVPGGGKQPELTQEEIDKYLDIATNNATSNQCMLGLTGTYDKIASDNLYTYFKMPNDIWDELVKVTNNNFDEIWKVNKSFIDEQIVSGKKILLSNNPYVGYYLDNGEPRFYQREIDYLKECGYYFMETQNGLWEAVR